MKCIMTYYSKSTMRIILQLLLLLLVTGYSYKYNRNRLISSSTSSLSLSSSLLYNSFEDNDNNDIRKLVEDEKRNFTL